MISTIANRRVVSDRRLLGWIRRRFHDSPGSIWVRVDVSAFAEFCGLSIRTGRNALNELRACQDQHGLKFRTIWRHGDTRKKIRGHWIVIVADTHQLLFDQEPLFRSEGGKDRHCRPQLREKPVEAPKRHHPLSENGRDGLRECQDTRTAPDQSLADSDANSETPGESAVGGGSECNAIYREYSLREFSREINTGGADFGRLPSGSAEPAAAERRRWRIQPISEDGRRRLRRKAAAMARRAAALWWDNVKVISPSSCWRTRSALIGWLANRLADGFTESAIMAALDLALHRLHGTATDRGEVFQVSSTLARAKDFLDQDGRTVAERANQFYQDRATALAEVRQWSALP